MNMISPQPRQQVPVSVVIPCYNLGQFLPAAIESIRRQTRRPLEILVVDDGSTDKDTRDVLDSLGDTDVTVIHQENQGVAPARDAGIRQASGTYICCLDADDLLRPEFLSKTSEILDQRPDLAVVSCHAQVFGEETATVRHPEVDLLGCLVENVVMVCSLFRREVWEKAGGFCSAVKIEDWDFWISVLKNDYRIHVIPEVLFEIRRRTKSRSSSSVSLEEWCGQYEQLVRRHLEAYRCHLPEVLVELYRRWHENARAWRDQREWIEQLQVEVEEYRAVRTERWYRWSRSLAALGNRLRGRSAPRGS